MPPYCADESESDIQLAKVKLGNLSLASYVLKLGKLLATHRLLILELARRDITDRHIGQVAGWLWAIAHPILLVGIYVAVFTIIFEIRVGTDGGSFTAFIISGLLVWVTLAECMNKAPTVIVGKANLVKQVVFPTDILPISGALSCLLVMLIGLPLLLIYMVFTGHNASLTWLLIVPLLAFQTMFMCGIMFLVSAVSVYFRDIKDIILFLTQAGLYITPALYPPDFLENSAPALNLLLYLNPASYFVWCYQDAIWHGSIVHTSAWIVVAITSPLLCLGGFVIFQKLSCFFPEQL